MLDVEVVGSALKGLDLATAEQTQKVALLGFEDFFSVLVGLGAFRGQGNVFLAAVLLIFSYTYQSVLFHVSQLSADVSLGLP